MSGTEIANKRITVIIPSLRRPDLVTACLESLSHQTLPHSDFEVLVVENEGREQDPSPEIPASLQVMRILLAHNLGTTASINHALTLSNSSYVLFLNNDVELEPNFMSALLEVLENDPSLGFATPQLLQARDRNRLDGAGDAMLLGGGAYRLGYSDTISDQFNVPGEALAGCGAATMYRRAMIADTGGLDEDFFAYLEDLDVALRGRLLGWKGAYVPSAVAYHIGSATLGDAIHPRIIRLLTRNQILLVTKNYPASLLLRLLPRILVYQLLWFVLALKRRALGAYVKGIAGAVSLLPGTLQKRRAMMSRRKISVVDFMWLLCSSERKIAAWHFGQGQNERSKLLNMYFRIFGVAKDPSERRAPAARAD
ncbi:MAG: glycosyltransferase family 2 protein [Acidobacteriales bacterium]|nr:glycosyltransferase family 2 protein [Terriglobales bacterium]